MVLFEFNKFKKVNFVIYFYIFFFIYIEEAVEYGKNKKRAFKKIEI